MTDRAMPTKEYLANLIAREVCGVENLMALYADKRAWTADQGRKYDINFPYQCDVLGCADVILAILPDPAKIRNEALEEAARVCDVNADSQAHSAAPMISGMHDGSRQCARKIRQLKTPSDGESTPPQPEEPKT